MGVRIFNLRLMIRPLEKQLCHANRSAKLIRVKQPIHFHPQAQSEKWFVMDRGVCGRYLKQYAVLILGLGTRKTQ